MPDKRRPLSSISPVIFLGSATIALLLLLYTGIAPDRAAALFQRANDWITAEAGWFYMLSVGIFVVFLLALAVSSHGSIKLGPDDSTPDYSYGTWIAMLFSAGMGIGIVYYGVAEPVTHFLAPPDAAPRTAQAARDAMALTFFHWGVHAWAVYAVIGLCLAYFGYRAGLPLAIRSAFYPLLGDRIQGRIGDVIDITAVVGTLAGIATSLGLGVSQLNASMNYLFGLPQTMSIQIVLIVIITALATISVATGLDNGIRRLSEMILIVSFVLMGLILLFGPTTFLLRAFVENIGLYLADFVVRTFHIYAYEPTDWVGAWTIFYWGWWISWSPFVGIFIARISRGRTIREFLFGVLFAPAGFSFLWFTIFGDTAIWLDINVADGAISAVVEDNISIALFTVFDYLPQPFILSWIAGLLVVVYFITVSDAGALVVAMITSGGREEPALWLRVFWSVICGAVAAGLLIAGGLDALQTASIIAALPFAVVMLLMCYGLWKGLSDETRQRASASLPPVPLVSADGAIPWERRLSAIVSHPSEGRVDSFIQNTIGGAMQAVMKELERRGLSGKVTSLEDGLQLTVAHGGDGNDFVYAVRTRSYPIPAFALAEAAEDQARRNRYYRAEVFLNQGGRGYDIFGYDGDQVIADIINHYDRFRHYLHLSEAPQATAAS